MSALPAHAVALSVDDDLRRSRLTVFFRLLLALPHLAWLLLWTIAAVVAAVANWLAMLVRGTPPSGLHRFERLFARFTEEALADPTPPAWSYALLETHPSVEERVAMARAWRERRR